MKLSLSKILAALIVLSLTLGVLGGTPAHAAEELGNWPSVVSMVPADPNPTSASEVGYYLTFSRSVSGLDETDFAVLMGGSVSDAAVINIKEVRLEMTFLVTVSTGTGSGTLGLNVLDDNSILDVWGNPLGGSGIGDGDFTKAEAYRVERNQAPTDLTLSNNMLKENQPTGTAVGDFTATDSDKGDTFTYSLVSGAGGDDNAAFTISGSQLQTAQPFNYLTKNSYSILVRVTDAGGEFFEKAFAISITDAPPIFWDVKDSYWAVSFIERLYNNGVTGGCSTSPLMYCPDTAVTRAQMAAFLLRAEHGSTYTPPDAVGTVFEDVPSSYWAAAWIEQLAAESITGGCGNRNYCPETPVTRDQMAVFLLRARYGNTYATPPALCVFADVPVGYWAASWIEQLYAEGITGGCGKRTYCPGTVVSRAQMAVLLVKTFNLP